MYENILIVYNDMTRYLCTYMFSICLEMYCTLLVITTIYNLSG
jgi:hypothetical protein